MLGNPPCENEVFKVNSSYGTPPGAVAQLGERSVRNAEVEGSIPFRSMTLGFPKSWVEPVV